MSQGAISAEVAHAFNRFGLGGRPDDVVPTDPVAWLTAQLAGPDPLSNAAPTIGACLGWVNAVQTAQTAAAKLAARKALANHFTAEQEMSLQVAVTTTTPFRERLVRFWANHFAILAGTDSTTATAGVFVREAIRPYVTDTFSNMLLAVIQHPAMLCSLNNDVSVGPQSPYGLHFGLGINENLGRETLELFTVGLAANYTQADVDAFAYILTGWNVSYAGQGVGFVIESDMHQPGTQTLLGTTYPGTIFDGYEVLQYLGTHPLTYLHIATKLVQHFVNDVPDPNDVATVVQALTSSNGNLGAAATALIGLTNAWVPQTKLRPPADWVIAAARAVAAPGSIVNGVAGALDSLGQRIWRPAFPNGYSDVGTDWASGSQMMLRTDWANGFCTHFGKTDPVATANTALGGLISANLSALLARVSATHDKLTILFCSPDFQRR